MESLPERSPAHPELHREVALGRQPVAWLERARFYQTANVRHDTCVQAVVRLTHWLKDSHARPFWLLRTVAGETSDLIPDPL